MKTLGQLPHLTYTTSLFTQIDIKKSRTFFLTSQKKKSRNV